MEEKRIWIVPNNDLEAKTIIEMLESAGEEYLVTEQTWGASWDGLEEEIKEALEENEKATKTETYEEEIKEPITLQTRGSWIYRGGDIVVTPFGAGRDENYIPPLHEGTYEDYLESERYARSEFRPNFKKRKKERIVSDSSKVYGIELQGKKLYDTATNIDHHRYGEDDRSNTESSIEQVAKILGIRMKIYERFVAENDKGYIPAMEQLGRRLGMKEEVLRDIIADIRMKDREAQGVTKEQEEQAEEAISKLGKIEDKRVYIQIDDLPHSKTSTITDRLYGKYDNLLITSQDGETNFYGSVEIIEMLNERFPGGWSGGQLEKSTGFWGGYADQEEIRKAVNEMIEELEKRTEKNAEGTITPNEIAKASKEMEVTTEEVKGIKRLFRRILEKFQSKGEK